jgi:hypothetical protein
MMKLFTGFFLCVFFVIGINLNSAYADPTIAVHSDLTEVVVGQPFSVEVIISDEDMDSMSAWNGTLHFNPGLLSLQNAAAGSFFADCSTEADFQFNEPSGGELIMVFYTYPTCPNAGQGTIAVIEFKALNAGNVLIEGADFVFANPDANSLPVQLSNAQLNIIETDCIADRDFDGDVDGKDVVKFAKGEGTVSLDKLAITLGRTNCLD